MIFSGAAVSGYPRALKTDDCEDILALFTWGMANAALQRKDAAQHALRRVDELSKGYLVPGHPVVLEAEAALKRLEEQTPSARQQAATTTSLR
jgi:hypothetical protein